MKFLITDFNPTVKNSFHLKNYFTEIGWGQFPFEVTDTGETGDDPAYPICVNDKGVGASIIYFEFTPIE